MVGKTYTDKDRLWTFGKSFNCCIFHVHKCWKCKTLWTKILILSWEKSSFSMYSSWQNSLQLWGKWHNYDAKQSKCPNFFSSGHKICILSCISVHLSKEERFSSCPFPAVFQRIWKCGFNSHCLRRPLNKEKCFSCNFFLWTCNKYHWWLYSWIAFHTRLRYHPIALVHTFWSIVKSQAMLCISGDFFFWSLYF